MLSLDAAAAVDERVDLAKFVASDAVFEKFGNVWVAGDADEVTRKGPTMIASTLHAVAILLRECKDWSWFINLSAGDYPLMPQDGEFLASQCIVFQKDAIFFHFVEMNECWKVKQLSLPTFAQNLKLYS